MHLLGKKLVGLLGVKSLVTLILTLVFAVLALRGEVDGQEFLTIFSVIVAFYYGTQSQRLNEAIGEKKHDQQP